MSREENPVESTDVDAGPVKISDYERPLLYMTIYVRLVWDLLLFSPHFHSEIRLLTSGTRRSRFHDTENPSSLRCRQLTSRRWRQEGRLRRTVTRVTPGSYVVCLQIKFR